MAALEHVAPRLSVYPVEYAWFQVSPRDAKLKFWKYCYALLKVDRSFTDEEVTPR